MKITQDKIFIFDLETTGDNPDVDQTCQISYILTRPDFSVIERATSYIKPGIPIKQEATDVHGITNEKVKDANEFCFFARNHALADKINGALIVGFNSDRFDNIILQHEFDRCRIPFDITKHESMDIYKMFRRMNPATLVDLIAKFLKRDISDDAHDAGTDTRYTMHLTQHFLRIYEDQLPETSDTITEFLLPPKRPDYIDRTGKIRFVNRKASVRFGKYDGKSLKWISNNDPGYLKWLMNNFDDAEVRDIARDALQGTYPIPEVATEDV